MMDAPSPLSFVKTTNPDDNNNNTNTKEEELIKFTEFKMLFNNKSFNIIISMTSDKQYLCVQSKEEGNFAYLFENKMNFIELMKFDKIFNTCEDLEDAYNSMVVILKNEKNLIKEIKDDKFIMSLFILNLDMTFREKSLELIKKNQNKDVIIQNLCQQIDELKKNNSNLLNEFDKIKIENNNLKENINSIMEWKNNLAQELNQLNEKINIYEFKLFKIDSNILKDQKEYDFIIERIKKVKSSSDFNISLSLLYRATRDGDEASDFHSRCDKSKSTLVIVKTKKGLRFGGFTTETWSGDDIDKMDDNAFCFSLDKMKIYNVVKGKKAIFASTYSGPAFENCIFQIKDNCFEEGGECSDNMNNNFNNQEKQFEINDGNENFKVAEVEVFGVIFY